MAGDRGYSVIYPVFDSALRREAALRIARTRRSLDWLLCRDEEGLALFREAHPDQMIVVVDLATGQPVGVATWYKGFRDVFITRREDFVALYGTFSGRLRLALYRLLPVVLSVRGSNYINTLWVDPAWRKRGAGESLVRAINAKLSGTLYIDIRAQDRRMQLIAAYWGYHPVPPGLRPWLMKLLGFSRMVRPAIGDGISG